MSDASRRSRSEERELRVERYRDLLAAAVARALVAGEAASLEAIIMGGDPKTAYRRAAATVWEAEVDALDAYLP